MSEEHIGSSYLKYGARCVGGQVSFQADLLLKEEPKVSTEYGAGGPWPVP